MLEAFLENTDLETLDKTLIVEGDFDVVLEKIKKFLEKSGVACIGNPDVYIENFSTFAVDDAKTLVERSSLKSQTGGKTFSIFSCSAITSEAANKLLKLFEDPGEDKYFIMLVPRISDLLPTLRSRVTALSHTSDSLDPNAQEFLRLNPIERISFIAKLLDKYKDDEDTGVERNDMTFLLESIEKILKKNFPTEKNIDAFKSIDLYRDYLSLRGSSPKMLLEHLAFILPVI